MTTLKIKQADGTWKKAITLGSFDAAKRAETAATTAQASASTAQNSASTAQAAASTAEAKSVIATAQANIASQKAVQITDSANQIETNRKNIAYLKNYVTPEMFGAVGDGVTDDTNKIREALYYASTNKIKLVITKKHYISGAINYYNNAYNSYTLNIEGVLPNALALYAPNEYGGFILGDNTSLFQNDGSNTSLDIKGCIKNLCVCGQHRNGEVKFFSGCRLLGVHFVNNCVSQIDTFCFNTSVAQCSLFDSNIFLTVYYFSRNTTGYNGFIDSKICKNYINGGKEKNDNYCFCFVDWNGSIVENNFIDYYMTIYYMNNLSSGTITGSMPLSCNNEYQVFRYFYRRSTKINSFTFSSNNDVFNWNDETALAGVGVNFDKVQYTNHAGTAVDIPPYIANPQEACNIEILNARIENNIGNLVFIGTSTTTQYAASHFKFTANGNIDYTNYTKYVTKADAHYAGGNYKWHCVDIPFILDLSTLSALPSITAQWNGYYQGEKIIFGNKIYRKQFLYDTTSSAWVNTWVDITNQFII